MTTTRSPISQVSRRTQVMSLSQQQRQKVAQFRDLTNCSDSTAQKYLKASHYQVDAAVDHYLRKQSTPRIDTKQIEKIFNTYADPTNKDEITIEGTIRYLEDLHLSLDEPGVLALAMQLEAPTQGTFTRAGFVKGWTTLGVATVEGMAQHVGTLTSRLSSDKDLFRRTYLYTFTFALTPPSRTLPLESALVFWDLLLTERFERLPAWKEFLEEKGRGVSRDTWNLLLDFSETVKTLEDYDESEAWPVVMDEFVAWCKAHNR